MTNITPPPAEIRARGNHLRHEASLYLQQHAHNPVDWHPWGEEALELARTLDRPLLVSSGYSSCHWCHVMEHEVFEHDDVAGVLNANYVCIKLDREERPDLDAAFMDALTAMSGGGGWPLNLFLTPQLKPFYGATYIPHDQFIAVALEIARIYREERAKVEGVGDELRAIVGSGPQAGPADGVDRAWLEALAQAALEQEDKQHGGFSAPVKFPMPPRWRFMLRRYRHGGDKRVAEMLRRALDAMAQGGIRDQLGGGFHRYTTDEAWSVPHFEKMLYDNAQLAQLYLEAGAALDEPAYTGAGCDTLDFMLREMRGPGGAFYASIDADSADGEGSYYLWTLRELIQVAGAQDGKALGILLRVFDDGPVEGKCVPTRRARQGLGALAAGCSEEQLDSVFERWRGALLEHRARRARPALDCKVVTAWNGMALAALAQAYLHTQDAHYLQAATEAAQYLWEHHRREDGGLWRASTAGVRSGTGVLGDYAQFALGLLELYCAGGDEQQLRRAMLLLDYALAHFRRAQGGYYLSPDDATAPLGRQADLFDNVEPSGGATLLHALWRAAALSGRGDYRDEVLQQLQDCAGLVRSAGLEMAAWCELTELVLGPFYTAVLCGAGSPGGRELLQAYGALLPGHSVLVQLPAGGADARTVKLIPAAEGKQAGAAGALICVCEQGACHPPCTTAAMLKSQLLHGWSC